jgi:hypothetical protein
VEPQPRVDRALEAPSKSSYHTQNQPTPSMHRISQIAQFFGQLLTSRESEAAYLEKLNEGIAKGTSWERVTEMIQLENSRKSKPGRQPSLPLYHLSTSLPSSLHPTSLFTSRARATSSHYSLRSQFADDQNPKLSDPLFPVDQTWQE